MNLTTIKSLFKKAYYSGLKYKCVYCNWRYRKFEPHGHSFEVLNRLHVIGGSRRMDSKCPICKSTDRERLLFFYYTKNILPETKSKRIRLLHVAPEKNFSALLVRNKNILYYSGDKFEKGYESSYHCDYLDITQIDFQDEYFDFVICNHVLEHVENYMDALKEINRVMKTGGKAVLQVPIAAKLDTTLENNEINTPEEREKVFGQRDHVRLFGLDYKDILVKAGFEVAIFSSSFLSDNNKTSLHGLNPEENLFQVTKICVV